MKRFLAVTLLTAVCLLSAVQAHAIKYGVVAGATFSSLQNVEQSSKTGWNLGATAQFKLPLGFSIQPSLIYNSKVAGIDAGLATADITVGYVELPVSLQWGPDLLVFRPFLDVSPYIGYAVNNKVSLSSILTETELKNPNLQRFEYGLGLGAGLEVWRFQVLCRYNWNFGPLFNDGKELDIPQLKDALKDKNFGGVTLSLAYLF